MFSTSYNAGRSATWQALAASSYCGEVAGRYGTMNVFSGAFLRDVARELCIDVFDK
jgi:cytidylate kinase